MTIIHPSLIIEHMNYYKYYKKLRLDELGIASDEEAEELEYELEVRFGEFTPKDRKTWLQQNVYLEFFSRIGTVTSAAREAGVTVYKAQTWKFDNVLGFTRRLEVADLAFNDRLKEKALRRASDPKAPATLLIELLRAYIPEEFSRNGHKCDTSKSDEILRRFREDARREMEAGHPTLRRIAQGDPDPFRRREDTPHPDLSPAGEDSHNSDLSPAGRDSHNSDLSPAGRDSHNSNLSPAGRDSHNSNLSPAGGETQRGGSSHPAPYSHQPSPDDIQPRDASETLPHEPTSPTRHSRAGGNPQTVSPSPFVPSQTRHTPSPTAPHEGPHHDDNPPLDTAESNLSPTLGDSHNVNLSPAGRDSHNVNLSPAGGEIQRGGPSRAQRREQLRQQRKAEKKNTFPVVRF